MRSAPRRPPPAAGQGISTRVFVNVYVTSASHRFARRDSTLPGLTLFSSHYWGTFKSIPNAAPMRRVAGPPNTPFTLKNIKWAAGKESVVWRKPEFRRSWGLLLGYRTWKGPRPWALGRKETLMARSRSLFSSPHRKEKERNKGQEAQAGLSESHCGCPALRARGPETPAQATHAGAPHSCTGIRGGKHPAASRNPEAC